MGYLVGGKPRSQTARGTKANDPDVQAERFGGSNPCISKFSKGFSSIYSTNTHLPGSRFPGCPLSLVWGNSGQYSLDQSIRNFPLHPWRFSHHLPRCQHQSICHPDDAGYIFRPRPPVSVSCPYA